MPVFTSLVLQATGHVDAAASVGRSHVLTDHVSSQASGLTSASHFQKLPCSPSAG